MTLHAATAAEGGLWGHRSDLPRRFVSRHSTRNMQHGLGGKIVQRHHPRHRRRQRRRNLRVAGVGPVLLTVHQVGVDLGVEGGLNLRLHAGKFDHSASVRDAVHLEAVRLQPSGDELQVLIRRSEVNAEFIGSEPLVVIRRSFVLLVVEQGAQGMVLLRAALQHQQHALQGQVRRRRRRYQTGVAPVGACCP